VSKIKTLELKKYLEEKNIIITNNKLSFNKVETKEDVLRQIDTIIHFQKSVGAYKENLLPRIRGSIGKEMDNYKSQIILVDRYIKKIKSREVLSKVDLYLINNGKLILNRASKSLNHIFSNDYKKIIERSMKNYEICLGRVDESNLIVTDDNKILVGTIRYLTYNIKEHDVYSFIKKMKRRKIDISLEEIIDYYVKKEGLDEISEAYLVGLSNYPNEQLKVIERYIQEKVSFNEDEILANLHKAEKLDNKYLIIGRRGSGNE
jgi:hypothetical protein